MEYLDIVDQSIKQDLLFLGDGTKYITTTDSERLEYLNEYSTN